MEIIKSEERIVDPEALNFQSGKFGTSINGQSFQHEALVTHKGWQYTPPIMTC